MMNIGVHVAYCCSISRSSLLCGAEQALRYQDLQTQSQPQNSCLSAAKESHLPPSIILTRAKPYGSRLNASFFALYLSPLNKLRCRTFGRDGALDLQRLPQMFRMWADPRATPTYLLSQARHQVAGKSLTRWWVHNPK
jgi:hypothetical protein